MLMRIFAGLCLAAEKADKKLLPCSIIGWPNYSRSLLHYRKSNSFSKTASQSGYSEGLRSRTFGYKVRSSPVENVHKRYKEGFSLSFDHD